MWCCQQLSGPLSVVLPLTANVPPTSDHRCRNVIDVGVFEAVVPSTEVLGKCGVPATVRVAAECRFVDGNVPPTSVTGDPNAPLTLVSLRLSGAID